MLWRALRHIDVGTFVDVRSADPIKVSVSYAFYERGWRGVHVEPVPAHAAALRTMRPEPRPHPATAIPTQPVAERDLV